MPSQATVYPRDFYNVHLQETGTEYGLIFVIMPFAPRFDPIYFTIKHTLEDELGYTVRRADDHVEPGYIMATVLNDIRIAECIIADITGDNPNVYYELGIANTVRAVENIIILVDRDSGTSPFDIASIRHIRYRNTPGCEAQLADQLKQAIVGTGDEDSARRKQALMTLKKSLKQWEASQQRVDVDEGVFLCLSQHLSCAKLTLSERHFLLYMAVHYGKDLEKWFKACAPEASEMTFITRRLTAMGVRPLWRIAAFLALSRPASLPLIDILRGQYGTYEGIPEILNAAREGTFWNMLVSRVHDSRDAKLEQVKRELFPLFDATFCSESRLDI